MTDRNLDQSDAAGKATARAGLASHLTSAAFALTDNLRGLPNEQRRACAAVQAAVIRAHGPDSCTKQQAAAHEGGHIITAWTYGQELSSARIEACRGPGPRNAWIGVTHASLRGRPASQLTTSAEDPSFAFRGAVDAMAGICAEIQAGLSHPSSSIDEQFRATAICADLSIVLERPLEHLLTAAVLLCRRALLTNEIPFEVVRGQLRTKRRITRNSLADVLRRGTRIEWNPAAFEAMDAAAPGGAGMADPYAALVRRAIARWDEAQHARKGAAS